MIHRLKKYIVPLGELSAFPFRSGRLYMHHAAVRITERIQYGPHSRQYLLYFQPAADIPLQNKWVVFFHGGGWHLGWPGMFPHLIDFFAGNGYHLLLPAYRLCPRFAFPAMRADVQAVLETALRLMRRDTGQGRPLIAGGMSAGATLAAHLAFDDTIWKSAGHDQRLLAGFLSCGGPLDLNHMPDTFVVRRFAGGRPGTSAFQAANPVHLIEDLPAVCPPAFFVHGTHDRIVPYRSARNFCERYAACGPVQWHRLEGGEHIDAIRWIDDDKETGAELLEWLDGLGDMRFSM